MKNYKLERGGPGIPEKSMKPDKTIEFRTLDYSNKAELMEYMRLFWASPLEYNEYAAPRPPA